MLRHSLALTASFIMAAPLAAQNMSTVAVQESFDDMEFSVESAILDMGLTIDFVSHSGDMLERTREDVGSDVVLFTNASIFNFCSARVSRQVIEADINNFAYCPYSIFVYATPANPDETIIGHQRYPGDTMQPANDFLDQIIENALQ